MKLSRIFLIIPVVIFIIGTSCEDFLERNPHDQISSGTFWKTEKDVEMALAGVYSRLYTEIYTHQRIRWDGLSDNCFYRQTSDFRNIAQGNFTQTTGDAIYNVYTSMYAAISSCNIFLDNIDIIDIPAEKIARYKGEVLFLRALHYFNLSEVYGAVPVHTERATLENAFVKQKPKEEVVEQILSDLNEAINLLPDEPYTNGHAVKGSAQALKAKVLLHNERWEEAAEAANLVINSGNFELYNNYSDMFVEVGQEHNNEILFSTRYSLPDNGNGGFVEVQYAWQNSLNIFQEFVDAFECVDGLPINESPMYNPDNYKENRDPRLIYTIKDDTKNWINTSGEEWNAVEINYTGYTTRKGVDLSLIPIDYSVRSGSDFIIMRYADVLLMYAEAKNEVSGAVQSVYDAVNAVRNRPSVEMPDLPEGLSKEQMRERIRHERRVEFGLEGTRYFDLKRWKVASDIISNVVDPGGIHRIFEEKHYFWPLHQNILDSNPELDQNPLWD